MQQPDYHTQEDFRTRVAKLEEIRALGVDPYPAKFTPAYSTGELLKKFEDKEVGTYDEAAEGKGQAASVAGRLVLFRAMGKNIFAHIQDMSGRIQVMFNRDHTAVTGFSGTPELSVQKFIEKKIDLGDIIGVEGILFRTQKGELTLFVKQFTLLCKSLLPLPDKHAGLADKGVRYRKRWLDLISNPESMQRFVMRSQIIQLTRGFLERQGFLEVETPVLQNVYGGAQARPFTTNLNALDQEMFLRISLEIPLKKLIVGGFDKVFEMSKVFRNEGIDRTHNPEFTEMEAYAAYWDYNDMMELMENLFELIAQRLFGKTLISVEKDGQVHEIELKAPWKRMTMKESIKAYGHVDVDALSDEKIREVLREKTTLDAFDINKATRGAMIAMLFEELAEKHLIQPHHITDHPIETTPLCKPHRNLKMREEGIVERFESFILGGEYANSYTELNDPILQRKLLEAQAEKQKAGDLEANPLDEEFIEAICQGMPPASGIGMGMDRIAMLFTNAQSIRDVLFFPLMKPED